MSVEQQYAQRTIRNLIARLAGRTAAQIVIGNHFDAWLLSASQIPALLIDTGGHDAIR